MGSLWMTLSKLGPFAWIMLMVIAVVAIEGIVRIVTMWIKHRERMVMIERGMDPGPAKQDGKEDED